MAPVNIEEKQKNQNEHKKFQFFWVFFSLFALYHIIHGAVCGGVSQKGAESRDKYNFEGEKLQTTKRKLRERKYTKRNKKRTF